MFQSPAEVYGELEGSNPLALTEARVAEESLIVQRTLSSFSLIARMRALAARCLRYFWLAAASTFLAGCIAGWVRLLPWLSAPELPWAALGPFVVELAIGAAQAAALLGVPLGAALGVLIFHERGEARALFALGVSPERCARTIATALFVPVLGVALAIGGARALLDSAPLESLVRTSEALRERCASAADPRAFPIPGTELSWLCGSPATPLLVGPLPGSAGELWLSGRSLELDTDGLSLRDALLTRRAAAGQVGVDLRVARFRWLGAVGTRPALPPFESFAAALVGVYLAALVLAAGLLRRERIPRSLPLVLGLVLGCSALALVGWLHQSDAAGGRALSAASSIAAPVLSASVWRGIDGAWTWLCRVCRRV
jgi:hypothetical protein